MCLPLLDTVEIVGTTRERKEAFCCVQRASRWNRPLFVILSCVNSMPNILFSTLFNQIINSFGFCTRSVYTVIWVMAATDNQHIACLQSALRLPQAAQKTIEPVFGKPVSDKPLAWLRREAASRSTQDQSTAAAAARTYPPADSECFLHRK